MTILFGCPAVVLINHTKTAVRQSSRRKPWDLGAKLENTVACALLHELHFTEDTTGSRVALHYLRDKEKHEVDFLPVVDDRPLCMIEVKVSDDNFSPSLFRFHSNLKKAKPFQIVYNLKHKKSKDSARMLPAHEFLRDLQLW